MSNFREIKEKFNALSPAQKDEFLKEVHGFSKDMRLFLERRFLRADIGKEFIRQMERETIDKVYRRGEPQTPDGRTVNAIIAKAKKSRVDIWTLLELEKLAYQGFIEFLNGYGGGPESFDEMACKHLEKYLMIVRDSVRDKEEQIKLFEEAKEYLLKKNNILTECLDETYEAVTGIPIQRR